jgi:hypothetical protein
MFTSKSLFSRITTSVLFLLAVIGILYLASIHMVDRSQYTTHYTKCYAACAAKYVSTKVMVETKARKYGAYCACYLLQPDVLKLEE